jgi:imidazolonepropionase
MCVPAEDELIALTRERLHTLLRHGTTTVEVKSGYGLDTDTELKQLRAVRAAAPTRSADGRATFLGAHEFPPEYRDDRGRYVDMLVGEMIPAVAAERLAVFCDVFMEPGVFTAGQTRAVLEAGLRHGLVPKLHADELENSGAAELAWNSARRRPTTSAPSAMPASRRWPVEPRWPRCCRPHCCSSGKYGSSRRRGACIDAGATVALATDFNPGSSPTPSMPLVLTLACSLMGMDPLEAIVAATAGGARALRLTDGTGTLATGRSRRPGWSGTWRSSGAALSLRFAAAARRVEARPPRVSDACDAGHPCIF